MLKTCALRIQDAVGLTFGSITQIRADKDGFRKLFIAGKKTSSRTVVVNEQTVAAIKAYQVEIGADNSDYIFEPGKGRNPANKWTKKIAKFFKDHNLKVKSHDFRVTQATEYYKATQDIVKTQHFLGHSKVETT